MIKERLMTVSETSQQLGVCESTIRKWIFSRKVGVCKIGRAVRIPSSTVSRLLQQGYRPAHDESAADCLQLEEGIAQLSTSGKAAL